MIEDTQSDYVEHLVEKNIQRPKIGIVTDVHQHDEKTDGYHHEVDVVLRDEVEVDDDGETNKRELKHVAVAVGHLGGVRVPAVDDVVIVQYLGAGGSTPVITGFLYALPPDEETRINDADNVDDDHIYRAPPGVEGEWKERHYGKAEIQLIKDQNDERIARIVRRTDEFGDPDMGIELNFDTGEMKMADGDGTGFETDGNGKLQFYADEVDFDTSGTKMSWSQSDYP